MILNRLIQLLAILPHGIDTLDRRRLINKPLARNAIRIWNNNFEDPKTIIDIGANDSQFAHWLSKEWPMADVISFEPNKFCQPIGKVMRYAIDEHDGEAWFSHKGENSHIDDNGTWRVQKRRLDNFITMFDAPHLLKVDAETHTLAALRGATWTLRQTSMVVVELCSDDHDIKSFRGQIVPILNLLSEMFEHCELDAVPRDGKCLVANAIFWK